VLLLQVNKYALYECRSINKLQNGAIPLIVKIGNIRNTRFVWNLILNIHIIFWWWRHYCDVTCSQNPVYRCIIFSQFSTI